MEVVLADSVSEVSSNGNRTPRHEDPQVNSDLLLLDKSVMPCLRVIGEGRSSRVFGHRYQECYGAAVECPIMHKVIQRFIDMGLNAPRYALEGRFVIRILKSEYDSVFGVAPGGTGGDDEETLSPQEVKKRQLALPGCEQAALAHLRPFVGQCVSITVRVVHPLHGAIEVFEGMVMPNFQTMPLSSVSLSSRIHTVEIKPKALWWPPTVLACSFHDDLTEPILQLHVAKRLRCRYSMMQRYKLATRKVSVMSDYCPNLLLNEQHRSLTLALRNLTSVPQNNLRYWVDGVEDTQSADESLTKEVLGVLKCTLSASKVFERISELQLRNQVDIELLESMVRHAHNNGTNILERVESLRHRHQQSMTEEMRQGIRAVHPLDGWTCKMDHRVYSELDRDATCSCQDQRPSRSMIFQETKTELFTLDELERAVDDFYVAASARDVSVMVTMCRTTPQAMTTFTNWTDVTQMGNGWTGRSCVRAVVCPEEGVLVGLQLRRNTGRPQEGKEVVCYLCRVAVVDIASKRHKSISHYFQQDLTILGYFQKGL